MVKKAIYVSKNIKDTENIAKIFLDKMLTGQRARKGALVVALSGDLGAGKTAFTKAVARHLGIRESVKSPTFVIMKKYSLKAKEHDFFFHFDAYRLESEKELLYLGWDDIIQRKEHLVFIEWPEKVSDIVPPNAVSVHISTNEDGHRKLEFR